MSPHGINSLVGDLVEMAKATERLPQLEQELAEANRRLNDREAHNAALEGNIIRYKSEIEELHAKVRSLEVERDDASFRVLEVEERTEKLERSFQSALEAMDATDRLIQSFKPVMPEPEKEPEAPAAEKFSSQAAPEAAYSIPETYSGQSESNPTTTGQDQNANSQTVTAAGNVSSIEPSRGPYFGKRYHDIPNYVSPHDWHEGGGTQEDYYWRPEARAPF